jgi:hypothetical protein
MTENNKMDNLLIEKPYIASAGTQMHTKLQTKKKQLNTQIKGEAASFHHTALQKNLLSIYPIHHPYTLSSPATKNNIAKTCEASEFRLLTA